MIDFAKLTLDLKRTRWIFSRSAAERILGLPSLTVQDVAVRTDNVYIFDGKNKYFLPKSEFYSEFIRCRRAKANEITAVPHKYSNLFKVTNHENGNQYPVRLLPDTVQCKCRDYEKQIELLGKGCCKHGYAVIGMLGHDSLASYINSNILEAA